MGFGDRSRALLAIGRGPALPEPFRSVRACGVLTLERARPSAASLRSTAFSIGISRRKPPAASRTVSATAACGGVDRNRSWAAPSRSRLVTVSSFGRKRSRAARCDRSGRAGVAPWSPAGGRRPGPGPQAGRAADGPGMSRRTAGDRARARGPAHPAPPAGHSVRRPQLAGRGASAAFSGRACAGRARRARPPGARRSGAHRHAASASRAERRRDQRARVSAVP